MARPKKIFSAQWEPRRVEVRRQFEPALALAERLELFGTQAAGAPSYDSSAWTGAIATIERVKAIRTLIPVAQNAVENLIVGLEAPRHNGGPPLDETASALESLKNLHTALGALLDAANDGKLSDVINNGLAVEAARYAKRAAKALKDDPMPYAVSALILAVMTACGIPDIGGYLTGVAISMKRK